MSDISTLVTRLEQAVSRLESVAAKGSAGSAAPAATSGAAGGAVLDGYDEIINGSLSTFLSLSKALGAEVAAQSEMVGRAFTAQRSFLSVVASSKQPNQATFGNLLKDTSAAISEITNYRESQRRSAQFNHLSAVSEGIFALGWVTMAPKPAPFVKEMSDAGQFYSNRVIKDFKEKDEQHVTWAKSFIAVLTDLHDYVKRVHTTGLVWNAKGGDATAAAAAAPAPTRAAAAAAPAPTRAAAAPKPAAAATAAPVAKPGANLFAELAKGTDITSGLKKVDKSQMTHKNPELRATSLVKAEDAKPKAAAAAPAAFKAAAAAKKPPVFELQGKKWVVEYQENNKDIVIEGDMKQSVYIYKCTGSTIQIKGKVSSIAFDGCKKTAVVFEECVASLEAINCVSCQVQVLKKVNTITIEKTDGIQVYLSEDSISAEIITAKSSEMNIMVPKGDGEFNECAVPEQFKTVWDKDAKKLVTTLNDVVA